MKHLKLPILYHSFSFKSLIIALGFLSIFAISSCSKDDDDDDTKQEQENVYNEEDPLDKFYELSGFTVTSNFVNSGSYEFGLAFTPLVKGKIKALKLKLPAVNNNVRVTIWDYDSKSVIRTEVMGTTVANQQAIKTIPELILEKNKKYLITMNSDDWYRRIRSDNANANYPITAGNIQFHEYRWLSGAAQVFPTIVSQNYNAGDITFSFQQID